MAFRTMYTYNVKDFASQPDTGTEHISKVVVRSLEVDPSTGEQNVSKKSYISEKTESFDQQAYIQSFRESSDLKCVLTSLAKSGAGSVAVNGTSATNLGDVYEMQTATASELRNIKNKQSEFTSALSSLAEKQKQADEAKKAESTLSPDEISSLRALIASRNA